MTVRVKICGITTRNDACNAIECGADFIGIIVDIAGSQRSVPPEIATEISAGIATTVVLMEARVKIIIPALRRINPYAVQLIGPYSLTDIAQLKQACSSSVWMTVHVPPGGCSSTPALVDRINRLHAAGLDAIVLDTLVAGLKGGTGRTCDWDTAAAIVRATELPVFLAGGLNPDNIARAADAVRPFGVDVSSGVETSPGRKDPGSVSRFIKLARSTGGSAP